MLTEIRKILKRKSDPEAKASFQKFIPSSQNVYGVRVPILNELASQFSGCGFELVQELWESGALEEKLLATKILGKVCKKDPDRTMALLLHFSNEVTDWAVCDTLATQGIRGIARMRQKEIFDLAGSLVKSDNKWQRRLGIVLLTNYAKQEELRDEILTTIQPLQHDGEYYVKKAMVWIKKDLDK